MQMTIYLALLRGINVGGNKKIKMADLRIMLEGMGLQRVQTYIQSGNVLFESDEPAETLQGKIEAEINRTFGFSSSVLLRTASEWKEVVAQCPFSFETLGEGESIHVSFLTHAPTPEEWDKLPDFQNEIDQYHIEGKTIYMYLKQSILDSKMAANLQKLGTPTTSRNWKTVLKLASMVDAMEK